MKLDAATIGEGQCGHWLQGSSALCGGPVLGVDVARWRDLVRTCSVGSDFQLLDDDPCRYYYECPCGPGGEVQVGNTGRLLIEGTLSVAGTAADPVVFT